MSMPPYELWLCGPESIARWMLTYGSGCRGSRLVPVASACGLPAFAQYRGNQAEQAACRRDAVHFCRGISDDAQVESCLVAHRHQVSARCRHVLQSHGR